MEKVRIELDAKWVKRVNSPFMYIIWALQGVSISFAPLFLYWAGAGMFPPKAKWVIVPLCFAVVYLIPIFYFWLGGTVIKELKKHAQTKNS